MRNVALALLCMGSGANLSLAKDVAGGPGPGYQRFANPPPFEASDAVQLPDGRILIVDDESDTPLTLVTLLTGRKIVTEKISLHKQFKKRGSERAVRELADLEGAAVAPDGRIYLMTSFSRKPSGRIDENRDKLASFTLQGTEVNQPVVRSDLRAALAALSPELAKASDYKVSESPAGLNIEGLVYDKAKERLLVGFRSPIVGGKALVVPLENPLDVVTKNAVPRFGAIAQINLGGAGIRAMTFDDKLGGFLILSGSAEGAALPIQLWLWDGMSTDPKHLTVEGWTDFAHGEGITPVRLKDDAFLMIVCDDGNSRKKRGSGYIFLDYAAIK